MARNVKKVKVQKQKHSKKFWAILWSSIVGGLAVIATVITLVLVLVVFKDEESYNYFKDIPTSATIKPGALSEIVENNEYEHIFIYYWSNELDPENNKDHKQIEEKVVSLYNAVTAYNAKETKLYTVAFFLVDTNTKAGKDALSNETLGNLGSANQLAYMYNHNVCDYAFGANDGDDMSGDTVSELTSAISFVRGLE
ncbi:MAG: hypothetical protein ACI35W_06735 [Anaeroplasmataceae bacterium]